MSTEASGEIDRSPPPSVDWSRVRKIHLMGICGSAMGALAVMLKTRGFEVRGSDAAPYPPMSDFLAAHQIEVTRGYLAEHLDWGPDLCVVGNVMRPDYPQTLAMRARGLPGASLPETLAALFLDGKVPVVVTGTHGKTTTSAMTAWLLTVAGLDPSFFIGGVARNFESNHRLGTGDHVVVEGDEYDTAFWDKGSKFLHYQPFLASINNLEMDHADIFADVEAIERTFTRFAALLPAVEAVDQPREPGAPVTPHAPRVPRLIVPRWEARALRAARSSKAPLWLTGLSDDGHEGAADVLADRLDYRPDGTSFDLLLPGLPPQRVHLPFPGRHNVMNALIAAGLAYAAGASAEAIGEGLTTFLLPLKRLTVRGVATPLGGETTPDNASGIPVYDDFAHHPTAISATLSALRQRHPGRRLVALFEAQSNTARRKVFEQGFGDALALADRVWFCKALEKKSDPLPADQRIDLDAVCRRLEAASVPATIIADIEPLAAAVVADARPGDVIAVLSGRDFGNIHDLLLRLL